MTRIVHVASPRCGEDYAAGLEWLAAELRREPADVLVVTGQLTDGAGGSLDAATRWLITVGAPLVLLPEPSDFPLRHRLARWFDPWREGDFIERDMREAVVRPDVVLVPVQIARSRGRAVFDAGSLSAALAVLAASPPDRLRLVAMARDPVEGDDPPDGGEAMLATLARAGADAILTTGVDGFVDRILPCAPRPLRLIASPPRTTAGWACSRIDVQAGALIVGTRAPGDTPLLPAPPPLSVSRATVPADRW